MAPVPGLPSVATKSHVEPIANHVDIAKLGKIPGEIRQKHMGVRLFPTPELTAPRGGRTTIDEALSIGCARAALPRPVRRKRVAKPDQERVFLWAKSATQTGGHGATQEVRSLSNLFWRGVPPDPVRTLEENRKPEVVQRLVQSGAQTDADRAERGGKNPRTGTTKAADGNMRICEGRGCHTDLLFWLHSPFLCPGTKALSRPESKGNLIWVVSGARATVTDPSAKNSFAFFEESYEAIHST